MSKILMPGEKTTLPDGRTVKFVEVDIDAMDDVCGGCAFEYENCTLKDKYVGPCGKFRTDGKFGIFVECKNNE